MKTRFFTVTVILMFTAVALQAQVTFGIAGGANFQNFTGKAADDSKLDNGLITSFHLGARANIPVADEFWFQPGLLYSQKGANIYSYVAIDKAASYDYNATARICYIEVPMNLLYRPQLGKGHVLLGFGPYIAFGVRGKETYDDLPIDERKIKFKSPVEPEEFFGTEYAYYRRFDAGANIYAGYELEMGLFFQFNTQLGLLKVNPEIEDFDTGEWAARNTGFGLSVGYNF